MLDAVDVLGLDTPKTRSQRTIICL